MKYGNFFWCSAALLVALAGLTWWLARRPAGAWRSRLVNATLALLSLLAPLVAAEGWFLFRVDTTDSCMATLTSQRWVERHLPSSGPFRGRTIRSADIPSWPKLFLVVMGDSITYGQGISSDQDLYPSRLERELRLRRVAADVYNLSFPGWNLPEETNALRRQYAAGNRFDVVVLGYCLNDMGTYVESVPGFTEAMALLNAPPALLAPLVGRSFVASYLFVQYVLHAAPFVKTWQKVGEAYRSADAFQQLARDLEKFQKLVESNGSRLVVLTFPDSSVPWGRYPYRDIHRKLGEYWAAAGVTHVDLLPVFERHPTESLHVSFMDTHPNERAHHLAAAALVDVLAEKLGLPGRSAVSPAAR